MSNNNEFHAKYGNEEYTVKIALINEKNDTFFIKKNAIHYLEIIDNVFNPFHQGVIIVTNDFNVFENGPVPYTFLGNGRDVICIDISPNLSIKDSVISLRCVVTECIEITHNNSVCKKFTFVEAEQFILNEKQCNIFDLKSLSGAAESAYLKSNAETALTTGDIIKRIINIVFNKGSQDMKMFTAEGKTYFDENGCKKVNLSPYKRYSYSELLMYMLQLHTSSDSPCFLSFDRRDKIFKLISYANIFKDSSKHTIERIKVADPKEKTIGDADYNISFNHSKAYFGDISQVYEYFVETPVARYNPELFSNESVTGYSKNNNTYMHDFNKLSKENYLKKYKEMFVEPFKSIFNTYQLEPNFTITTKDQSQRWVDTDSSLPTTIAQTHAHVLKYNSLLYMNFTYIFKLRGNTLRLSGNFVDVVKQSKQKNEQASQGDLNLLGRHFITCVKHIFTHDKYLNQVETIKPYKLTTGDSSSINDFIK